MGAQNVLHDLNFLMSCTLVGDFCVSIRVKAVLVVGMY